MKCMEHSVEREKKDNLTSHDHNDLIHKKNYWIYSCNYWWFDHICPENTGAYTWTMMFFRLGLIIKRRNKYCNAGKIVVN